VRYSKPQPMNNQLFKIQMKGVSGWGDLKTSYDDGLNYVTETYITEQEAQNEINDIVEGTEENKSDYRVVDFNVPADENFYY